jgi:hypothetical protein
MGVVRILVGVTNVNSIPESPNIVVGEGLYEIYFKVDKVCKEGAWMDYKPEVKKDLGDNGHLDDDFDGTNDQQPKTDTTINSFEMEDNPADNSGKFQD